ncbi:MAG: nucleotidyltransferase family protein [Solirubrobacterales bacterium]|nr:nucleotidyltransferase family protein [Solirubrobacterales bacterium]
MAAQADPPKLTPEQELILLSAAAPPRREAQRGRFGSLARSVDWTTLAELLTHGRLLPTLGPRIVTEAGEATDPAFRQAASGSVEAVRRQDALLLLMGQRLIDALREREIPTAPLKGPALGEQLYGEPGRRLSSDIDLLLPAERLSEAVRIAESVGYDSPTDPLEANGLPLLHFAMPHRGGELPAVELHWRIHWYEDRFACERLLPPAAGDTWHPEPIDQLVALLLFYARDGFSGLRQATDLAAWWDRFGEEMRGSELERRLLSYPQLRPAVTAAVRAAERIVGLPAARLLDGSRGLSRRGSVAVALVDPRPYATTQQLYAEIGLIDGLLTPRGGLGAFLRRQVVPPAEVIRDHAQKAFGAHVTSRAGYAVRVLGRYALALGRLLRLPGTVGARFSSEELG